MIRVLRVRTVVPMADSAGSHGLSTTQNAVNFTRLLLLFFIVLGWAI